MSNNIEVFIRILNIINSNCGQFRPLSYENQKNIRRIYKTIYDDGTHELFEDCFGMMVKNNIPEDVYKKICNVHTVYERLLFRILPDDVEMLKNDYERYDEVIKNFIITSVKLAINKLKQVFSDDNIKTSMENMYCVNDLEQYLSVSYVLNDFNNMKLDDNYGEIDIYYDIENVINKLLNYIIKYPRGGYVKLCKAVNNHDYLYVKSAVNEICEDDMMKYFLNEFNETYRMKYNGEYIKFIEYIEKKCYE